MTRNLQKERQQRGKDFENELRRGWRLVPNTWRLKLRDGGGGTVAGDSLVLTVGGNILYEAKRTAGDRFELSMLTPGELKGLTDFDEILPGNRGLVFISFLNEFIGPQVVDEAYAFRLLPALRFMQKRGTAYITREQLRKLSRVGQHVGFRVLDVPIHTNEKGERFAYLQEVPKICTLL